jgi:hypothetical protein
MATTNQRGSMTKARNGFLALSFMTDRQVRAMCLAYREMNIIRARDGVPRMFNGRTSDITQEAWDDIMKELDDCVKDETGNGCWLHPILFQ